MNQMKSNVLRSLRVELIALMFVLCGSWQAYALDSDSVIAINMIMVGDLMQHNSQLQSALNTETGIYDYSKCFEYVQPIISNADVAIGNLETTFGGPPYKGYPQFSSPFEYGKAMKNAGFDVLMTANNHSVDRYAKGLDNTIAVLDSLNIFHTGTYRTANAREILSPLIVDVKGIKIAMLNYTFSTNGINVPAPFVVNKIDRNQIKSDLEHTRELNPDFVMIYFHWGNEYSTTPTSSQVSLSQFCLENGADMIVGAHPHVLQRVDKMAYTRDGKSREGYVFYSLGNFLTGFKGKLTSGSAMIDVNIHKNVGTGETYISSAGFIPTWVQRSRNYSVVPISAVEDDLITVFMNPTEMSEMVASVYETRIMLRTNLDEYSYNISDLVIEDALEQIAISENLNPVDSGVVVPITLPDMELASVAPPLQEEEIPEPVETIDPVVPDPEPKEKMVRLVITSKQQVDPDEEKVFLASNPGDTLYMIQFFALTRKVSVDTYVYPSVKGYEVKLEGGYYKYLMGRFEDLSLAEDKIFEMKENGLKDSFIVAYVDGKRVRFTFND